jgi:transcriptional regulator GlxA family with amidase domain
MPRRVVFLAFDGVQSLDLSGPLEVFATAARIGEPRAPRYDVEVCARVAGPFTSSSGLTMIARRGIGQARAAIDTLIVPGGIGTRAAMRDARFLAAMKRAAARARRVASVCTGALLLAEAGLLDGSPATTHWAFCDLLRRVRPAVDVQPDPIFVRAGKIWTSAGVTAGIDLALALVEEDHGAELARDVARWLVMYTRRAGGQSQFSAPLSAPHVARAPMRELAAWVLENLAADLSVAALARRARMSPRNFARVFRRDVGRTPAEHVQALRVEAARGALEATSRSIDEVATDCGFGTTETMHRVFRRALGVTPGDYRRRFAPLSEGAPP